MKSLSNTEFQRFETHIEVSPQLLSVLTIQRLATGLDQLAVEPSNWWHAIQDFDLALMSQLIAFLSGTTQLGALKKNAQEKVWEQLESRSATNEILKDKRGKPIEDEIASLTELLNRALDPKFPFVDNSLSPLRLSKAQKDDILRLHRFRNNLAHVRPLSWSVEVVGLPRMALACTYAIQHLFTHSTQRIHLSDQQVESAEANLATISQALQAMN